MSRIKRVLITGAAGYIGSLLTRNLLTRGFETGILLRDTSDLSRIEEFLPKVTVCHCDLRDGEELIQRVKEFSPDCIMHLVTHYAVEHVSEEVGIMLDTNVRGTVNLLEAARLCNVKLFLNASTCAVYEQKDRPLTEEDSVRPQNLYALTKYQAEEACRFYADNYGVDAVTLRLFPPYGPGDHERRLLPYVIQSLRKGVSPNLTTGLQKWDFVYIDDIVKAFIAVLDTYPFPNHYDVINIGTGTPVSVREALTLLLEIMEIQVPLSWGSVPHRKNEVWFNSADIRKAKHLLGWEPETDIRKGLERTVEGFPAQNGSRYDR